MTVHLVEQYLKNIRADLLAEFVLRELESGEVFADYEMAAVPQGGFGRAVSRDVAGLEIKHHPVTDAAFLTLQTAREGLTDMLPPGMIFQPEMSREERTAEVMLESSELREAEFQYARQFLSPFDIAIAEQRLLIEKSEHCATVNPYLCFAGELLEALWPELPVSLTSPQSALLLELTLNAGCHAGDISFCEEALKRMLGYPVSISVAGGKVREVALAKLGEITLGADWIPFEMMDDPLHLDIAVGPVPSAGMVDFRYHEPAGSQYRLLGFLCELLLPAEYSWSLRLIPGESGFQIGRKNDAGILGYSTILG